jgi:hypothetical protein
MLDRGEFIDKTKEDLISSLNQVEYDDDPTEEQLVLFEQIRIIIRAADFDALTETQNINIQDLYAWKGVEE